MEPTQLKWIDHQQTSMLDRLCLWAGVNSGSDNIAGLESLLHLIKPQLDEISDTVNVVQLPPRSFISDEGISISQPLGKSLHAITRPSAPIQVFLGGHMDTVFSVDHPFQTTTRTEPNILTGPGVADMKGGLIVMLTALKALEMTDSPIVKNIGWEVVINSDEEVGSPGSENLLLECASRCHYALLFEPSFPDGAFVDARKGSLNLTAIARGKAAHAGRDFDKGVSAITALARFIVEADRLNDVKRSVTVNFGKITGGGPINIVPDLAICHLNARAFENQDFKILESSLRSIAKNHNIELRDLSSREPKPFDERSRNLFKLVQQCAEIDNIAFKHHSSGGVCDGNIFASKGIPVIDTLGVIGGGLHTETEYMLIDSLVSRARLTYRLLLSLAEAKF